MKLRSRAGFMVLAAGVCLASFAGCRTAVRTVPPPVPASREAAGTPAPARTVLARLGYSVQVGAFAVYDNV